VTSVRSERPGYGLTTLTLTGKSREFCQVREAYSGTITRPPSLWKSCLSK